jgi:hypothetical protein
MDKSKKIICLTPTKNEEWIIERFLKQASLWADHIIILDQNSNDKTVEIAESFSKVVLIKNTEDIYDEAHRQKKLINEARKRFGTDNILIALDADEALTSNFLESVEWQKIKNLERGTVLRFEWLNVLPAKNTYWKASSLAPFGFIDDGTNHEGQTIHSWRVPTIGKPTFDLKEVKVLHFQYADWDRMESKHRWYQCFEKIKDPKRNVLSIYRQYHHMYGISNKMKIIKNKWFFNYDNLNIDYSNFKSQKNYHWDYEVLKLIKKYGSDFFGNIDIWSVNWKMLAEEKGLNIEISKPRLFNKLLLCYLKKTTSFYNRFILFRVFERVVVSFF